MIAKKKLDMYLFKGFISFGCAACYSITNLSITSNSTKFGQINYLYVLAPVLFKRIPVLLHNLLNK